MQQREVLVQSVSAHAALAEERRSTERHGSNLEALTRPLDAQDALWWGATVRDISASGIGLTICYPFRVGAYLAVDLQSQQTAGRTLLTRVVHVQDRSDGAWQVGCEFVKKLTDSDLEMIL
ncbi:MAG: PilZ domain-containing protein [Gemmataceae bacterium]